jgi:hypothetical protein
MGCSGGALALPAREAGKGRQRRDAMPHKLNSEIAVIGIDIGKNSAARFLQSWAARFIRSVR